MSSYADVFLLIFSKTAVLQVLVINALSTLSGKDKASLTQFGSSGLEDSVRGRCGKADCLGIKGWCRIHLLSLVSVSSSVLVESECVG